jgi:uncharacterized protein YbbK (DUF523 family)
MSIALTGDIEGARMVGVIADREGQEHDLHLVSACLLGVSCRFDGQSCPAPELNDLATRGKVVAICPEVAGGLPIPRLPAEIEEASAGLDGYAVLDGRTRVLRSDGVDVTSQFIKGAEAALTVSRQLGIRQAILKANSPSCGAGCIHDGRFSGKTVPGDGITAALLKHSGIHVITETDLTGGDP